VVDELEEQDNENHDNWIVWEHGLPLVMSQKCLGM
jgi:hypothetical protein